uniref:(northern house mosquito) hypothetical protein n=2 Tax=Culex pipiens TaxID=7175 RepID=A0A8D8K248_CULPI
MWMPIRGRRRVGQLPVTFLVVVLRGRRTRRFSRRRTVLVPVTVLFPLPIAILAPIAVFILVPLAVLPVLVLLTTTAASTNSASSACASSPRPATPDREDVYVSS